MPFIKLTPRIAKRIWIRRQYEKIMWGFVLDTIWGMVYSLAKTLK